MKMIAKPASFLWSEGAGILTTLSRVYRGQPSLGKSCLTSQFRPRQRWGPPNQAPPRIVAAAIRGEFVHELRHVCRQRSPRIPGDGHPSSDRHLTLDERESSEMCWNEHCRWNYGDTVADLCQGNESMRSCALKQNASVQMRIVEGSVEPLTRSEGAVEQKQPFLRQVLNLEHSTTA